MAGQRDRNLRQGDIAEQLGFLLLQGVAAVAPVPRTEDMGIDAICTLLRREGSRRLIAEDSFHVQLKAASIKQVKYAGDEITWLRALRQPLFIGRVDIARGRIQLYAAHELYRLFAEWDVLGDFKLLRAILKDGKPRDFDKPGERRLHFGPPVLEWDVHELANPNFLENAYQVLNGHIAAMHTNLASARAGFHLNVTWSTNRRIVHENASQTYGNSIALYRTLNDAWRYIHAWYFNLRGLELFPEAETLYKLLIAMERIGWTLPADGELMHAMRRVDEVRAARLHSDPPMNDQDDAEPGLSG